MKPRIKPKQGKANEWKVMRITWPVKQNARKKSWKQETKYGKEASGQGEANVNESGEQMRCRSGAGKVECGREAKTPKSDEKSNLDFEMSWNSLEWSWKRKSDVTNQKQWKGRSGKICLIELNLRQKETHCLLMPVNSSYFRWWKTTCGGIDLKSKWWPR